MTAFYDTTHVKNTFFSVSNDLLSEPLILSSRAYAIIWTTLKIHLIVGCAAFYAVHGLLRENSYELFAFVLATLLVLVYCIVDIVVNVEGRSVLKWVCTQNA